MDIRIFHEKPAERRPFQVRDEYKVTRGGPNGTQLVMEFVAASGAEASRIANEVAYVWYWSAWSEGERHGKPRPSEHDFEFAFRCTTVVDHR